MTEERKCPPLGTGSVDFSALHEADRRGEDLTVAIEAATTRVELPSPLTGKERLDQLKAIAASEGIEVGADWHRDDYAAAIDAKRSPPPRQGYFDEPVETSADASTGEDKAVPDQSSNNAADDGA